MAENEKDITTEELPEPISREDALLHNIIDGTPDISDLEPLSREEVYLKYIALNGGSGGGGGGDVNIVQTTGQSTTSVMSQKAVTDNLVTKVDIVEGKGLSTEDFTTEYKDKLDNIPNDIGDLGTAAYCDTGLSEGNVPILNSEGKLDNSVIPSLAITDTFVANSEEEMLNITGAEKGDICVRTDENKTYILDETPSRYRRSVSRTSLSDWIELQTPTDEVTSVNGQKGTVVITAEDIDTYTKTEIDGKLPNIVQTIGTSETDVMSQKAVTNNTCFGNGASAINGTISIGNDSKSSNQETVAIGNSATSSGGGYGVSIGRSSSATGYMSVSLGAWSTATENSIISVGDGSTDTDYGTRRIVNVKDPINDQDAATKKYVDDKVSDISTPTIVQATGTSETDVMSQKSVTDSLATKVDTVEGKRLSTEDFTTEYKTKLTNLPDEIPEITIVQERGTSETSIMSQNAVSKNTCLGYLASDEGIDNVTIGRSSHSTGYSNVAIGDMAEANIEDHIENAADNSVAIGGGASVTKTQGSSIGGYSVCTGKNSVALGYGSKATEDNVVSVSNPNFIIKRRIVNVSDPVNDQDAATKLYVDNKVADSSNVTVVQTIGDSETDVMSQKAVSNNTCFGDGAQSSDEGTAVGKLSNSTGSYASAFGRGATANNDSSSAFGRGATAENKFSVALGAYSKASENYVVSIGSGESGYIYSTRRIVNVKDPVNNQDAATKNYVDTRIVTYNATLLADSWLHQPVSITDSYYMQDINMSGILESDNPIVSVVIDTITNESTSQNAKKQLSEFSKICQIVTMPSTIRAKCFITPTIDLNIRLVCFR